MMNFLHTYQPNSILISLGPIQIHWYGLLIVSGALLAILVSVKLADYYQIKKEIFIDLAFWLIIGSLVGARLYHVLVELPYYLQRPLAIFYLWQGGLAIYGAIFTGLVILWWYTKKHLLNFWQLTALIVPGLALAQAIGRWGNYFNQELFGQPTNLTWGIPIDLVNRPVEYFSSQYFHPVFLYESLGDLLIFIILIIAHLYIIKKTASHDLKIFCYKLLVICYLFLYSCLRFALEYLRIDPTPVFFNLRFAQLVSLIVIISSLVYLIYSVLKNKKIHAIIT